MENRETVKDNPVVVSKSREMRKEWTERKLSKRHETDSQKYLQET